MQDLARAQDQVCPIRHMPSVCVVTSLSDSGYFEPCPSQSIYVFNKYYLDAEFDEVIKLLHVQPPLQPPIEGTFLS